MAFEDIQRVDRLGKRQECPYSGTCLYLFKKKKKETLGGERCVCHPKMAHGAFFQTANSLGCRRAFTGLVTLEPDRSSRKELLVGHLSRLRRLCYNYFDLHTDTQMHQKISCSNALAVSVVHLQPFASELWTTPPRKKIPTCFIST